MSWTCPKCLSENADFIIEGLRKTKCLCGYDMSSIGSNTDVVKLTNPQPAIMVYAGFWRRFVAAIIDNIILIIVGVIVGAIIGGIIGGVLGFLGTELGTIRVVAGGVGYILGTVLGWLYFTLFESSSKQATLGKQIIKIVVTDLNGHRISFGKANARYWGKIVSIITLMIGFIMTGFTKRKQALHDIMAGSLVVKK